MATLAELMDAAGLAGPENELLKAQYIQALKQKATKQPGSMETRDMTVAASPVANIASTLAQVLGGIDSRSYMDAMSGNLRKQQDFRTGLVNEATQPGADQGRMQYMATGGGEPALSGVANAEQVRAQKAELEGLRRENTRYLLEKALGNRKELAEGDWQLKRDQFMPFAGNWNADTGGYTINKKDGTLIQKPGDPAFAAAKDARAAAVVTKPKNLSDTERTKMEDSNAIVKGLIGLESTFRPEYALKSWGPLGGARRTVAHMTGGLADKDTQAMDNWWTDWDNKYQLLRRHQMFGSALTKTEKASWALAQKVRPGADAKTISEGVAALRKMTAEKLRAHAEGRIKGGYNADEIKSFADTAFVPGEEAPNAPAPAEQVKIRKFKRVDGKLVEE